MLIYEVTLEVDPAVAEAVESHMRGEHIPEIATTGCFSRIRFDRDSKATRFRTSYEASDEADLELYFRQHAPRLRASFQERFPTGVTIARETWTPLESWE